MFSPCKKCLVRPACSVDCKEYHEYVAACTCLITFASIILAGITIFIIFYYFGLLSENITDNQRWGASFLWAVTVVASLMMNVNTKEKINELAVILFAPFVFFVFIYMYIISFFLTRNIRKRA